MKLTDRKIKETIENNPLAFATVEDKRPYVIGVTYCKVIRNRIIITDNFMGRTIKNIERNDNIGLIVWDKKLNGYQFLGKAKYYDKGKWLQFVRNLKENKNMPAKGAVVVTVEHIIKSR